MPEVCNDTIRNRWRGGYEKKLVIPNELIKGLILKDGEEGRMSGAFRSPH